MVLIYLLTFTPLAPALTTLLAMADRSHRVTVGQTVEGMRVVLRHDCVNSLTHRHSFIARVLVLVAKRQVKKQSDHVIQFAASTTSEQSSALAIATAPDRPAPELLAPSNLFPCAARLAATPLRHPRPPPDAGGAPLSVRSTVLLI